MQGGEELKLNLQSEMCNKFNWTRILWVNLEWIELIIIAIH